MTSQASSLSADPASALSAAPELSEAALLLQRAMTAHRESRVDEASAAYQQLLALEPDHPDGLHLYGLLQAHRGRLEQAQQLIARAISLQPGEAIFHNNMGNVLMGLDQLAEAEAQYRQALMLDSDRLDAINNLGVLVGQRRDFEGAETIFIRLLEVSPGFSDARQNLAQLYLSMGRVSDAVHQCAMGLVTAPRNRGIRNMLGLAYGALGRREEATELYRKWLEEEPGNVIAAHHYAAYSGQQVPDQASDEYVRSTFDNFASSFDSKLAQLDYCAPQLVGDAVAREMGEPDGTLRIADAGCGTGLCAPYLAPYARVLVGVDLSGAMLERAAVRKAYSELLQGDLTAFLDSRPNAFDVLVSADTLCYFGRLDGFAAAARRTLAARGLLVFTVEAHDPLPDAPEWRLQTHGRYSHRKDYLQSVLVAAGFAPPTIESVVLRQEARKPVFGWLVHCNVA